MKKKSVFIIAFVLCLGISFLCFASKEYWFEIENPDDGVEEVAFLKIHGALPAEFEFGGVFKGRKRFILNISDQPNLCRLILKDGVEAIYELRNCPNLEYIEIGKDFESIWIWSGCSNINYSVKEFVVDPENTHLKVVDRCLVYKEKNSVARAPKDIAIIPSSCTQIDIGAFFETDIALGRNSLDNITRIEHFAFYNCEKITSVYFPENIELGGELFYGCSDLSYVYIPSTASRYSYLDASPFYGLSTTATIYCENLEDYLPQISDWYWNSSPFAVDSLEAFMTYWGFVDTQTLIFGKTADDMEKAILDKSK